MGITKEQLGSALAATKTYVDKLPAENVKLSDGTSIQQYITESREIFISENEPTNKNGKDGDVWFVVDLSAE